MDEGRHRTLGRGFAALEALAESANGLTVSEVAAVAGLDKSTTSRLVGSLEAMGYVVRQPDRTLILGGKVLRLSRGFRTQFNLKDHARSVLEEVRDYTEETAILAVREGDHSACVDQADPPHDLRMVSHVGLRTPMHATAGGRAMLFSLPEAEQLRVLEASADEPVEHPEVNLTLGQLRKENDRARQLGYVHIPRTDDIERVAAPILDAVGRPLGAIVVYGPKFRMQDRLQSIGLACRKGAGTVSRQLSGEPAMK